jgi:predicted double-glycine peptidase
MLSGRLTCVQPHRGLHILLGVSLAMLSGAVSAATVVLPDVGGSTVTIPVRTLQERRFTGTIHQRFDFSCGSAALATLLTFHYAHAVSEDDVFAEMFARADQDKVRREGFSLLDMKQYLDAHGMRAGGYRVPLARLAAAHIPAIVLINEKGYNHFVVIKGITADRVLLGDPAKGARAVSRNEFQRIWQNGIVLVVDRGGGAARFNAQQDWDVEPLAPLKGAVQRDGLWQLVMPKHGPGGF